MPGSEDLTIYLTWFVVPDWIAKYHVLLLAKASVAFPVESEQRKTKDSYLSENV